MCHTVLTRLDCTVCQRRTGEVMETDVCPPSRRGETCEQTYKNETEYVDEENCKVCRRRKREREEGARGERARGNGESDPV